MSFFSALFVLYFCQSRWINFMLFDVICCKSHTNTASRGYCLFILCWTVHSSHRPTPSSENFLFKSIYDIDIDIAVLFVCVSRTRSQLQMTLIGWVSGQAWISHVESWPSSAGLSWHCGHALTAFRRAYWRLTTTFCSQTQRSETFKQLKEMATFGQQTVLDDAV